MKPAVNTVTLRSCAPEEIVSILKSEKIDAIEWAGDVHVPTGDIQKAEVVKALCEANEITATSYGSYYQCDLGGKGKGPFQYNLGAEPALETARALGVKAIRVWAGRKASETASPAYRDEVTHCLRDFCDKASSYGMTVHLEFHRNTLTDTAVSALALIKGVARDNLYSYWQPRHGASVESNVSDIETLGEHLSHLHVFHWDLKEDGAIERRPLKEGQERWQAYFEAINQLPNERYAMIEFVRNDELSQFSEDVAVLHSLIRD